jgi:hypothetical protein
MGWTDFIEMTPGRPDYGISGRAVHAGGPGWA